MKIEIKPDCASLSDVPKIIKTALKYGFLCGSRKFGISHEKSDYDYIVKKEDIEDFVDIKALKKYNENSHLPTLAMRVNVDNKSFNILVTLNTDEFTSWVRSTNQFIELLRNDIFKEIVLDKDTRVAVFERLREINGIGNK